MHASFQGQNIFALGNGIAMLKSAWTEAEPPLAKDAQKQKLVRDAAELARATLSREVKA